VAINTIGPVWDGNEVWLLVAGGATFAAFPEWYASLFSGFFLALLLVLVALIVRGVAFEFRGKVDSDRWRRNWDRAIVVGSTVPALLWGVAFANIVAGVPLDADHEFTGSLLTLLNPYALLGGLATLSLFALHGAVFLALKTHGPVRHRARVAARTSAFAAVPVVGGFLAWTVRDQGSGAVAALLAVGLLLASVAAAARRREGWAFAATAASIVALAVVVFDGLHPALMRSTVSPAFDLTVANASSGPYTLGVLSVIGAVFLPLVIGYQTWSYWVFRKRVRVEAA
jgi:cytochrome d ubiquinol oxidase subunit II